MKEYDLWGETYNETDQISTGTTPLNSYNEIALSFFHPSIYLHSH